MSGGQPELAALEQRLGYSFVDRERLLLALTHESFVNEAEPAVESNERLEFLGDSVLGLVVASYLFKTYPELSEGDLARMKSHLVSTQHLAEIASGLELGDHLRLGRGELLTHGRKRRSLLADALEAVIGSVYLDGGFEPARQLVIRLLQEDMDNGLGLRKDYKSALQEWTQSHFKELPEYLVIREEGPPHERVFEVEVRFHDHRLGGGAGGSKRDASQVAAREALERIRNEEIRWQEWVENEEPA
ncbi:MAG: ribonuclease III [Candidatus Eremiobacteraeota bacterium]|nr:ribonuclease III [Candidatus Eremiobacteraeota bacterium]